MVRIVALLVLGHALVQAQHFEGEGLVSNPQHRTSRWFIEYSSVHPNVDSIRAWMRADPSIIDGQPSREYRQVRKFIARNWHHVLADGTIAQHPSASSVGARNKKGIILHNAASWKNIGPFGWDTVAPPATGSMGLGVVRCIAPLSTNHNNILIGTISAGVWKKTADKQWYNVTDPLPVTTVFELATSNADDAFVYAATNLGILRSLDSGETFEATSLSDVNIYPASSPSHIVAVSPKNPFHVVASWNDALYWSTDAGDTWSKSTGADGMYWDVRWHPTNDSVVYVLRNDGRWTTLLVSRDGGVTFSVESQGLPVQRDDGQLPRGRLAVSRSTPNNLWVLFPGSTADTNAGVWGLYVSRDQGRSFSHICCGEIDGPEPPNEKNNPNLFGYDVQSPGLGQVTWDMAFDVSDVDSALMVVGGIFPYVSYDGGRTWEGCAPLHYDVQDVEIGDDAIWLAHDGGIHTIDAATRNVADQSFGLCALEVWGYGQSHRSGVAALGAYHMPIFIRDKHVYDTTAYSGGWYPWSGADAMNADVNPDDDRWVYAKPWSSVRAYRPMRSMSLPRSNPLGIDLGYISLTNLAFHPSKSYSIVAADHADLSVKQSADNAASWNTVLQFSSWLSHVKYSTNDPNLLLAVGDNQLHISTDGGNTWEDRTPERSLTGPYRISDATFDIDQKNVVWISYNGHQTDAKILRSDNLGLSWHHDQQGLPSYAVRCLSPLASSIGTLAAGTEYGVFVRQSNGLWSELASGLPATPVKFLRHEQSTGSVVAATDRGLWSVKVPPREQVTGSISRSKDTVWCSNTTVEFYDRISIANDDIIKREWILPGATPSSSTEAIPSVRYAQPGIFSATLTLQTSVGEFTLDLDSAVVVMPSQCSETDVVAGSALSLTADTDYALLPAVADSLSAFTFSAWVMPHGYQPNFSTVFCSDGGGNTQEFGMQFIGDSNELGYLWTGGHWWWRSGLFLQPDVWSHVALIVDSTGATVLVNGTPSKHTIALSPIDVSELSVALGTYHFWQSRNANIDIDEVRMYNKALDVDSLRLGMHHPVGTYANMLALYQFNEPMSAPMFNKIDGTHLELGAGAQRLPSSIPFGIGTSELKNTTTPRWIAFSKVGVEVDVNNTVDSRIMASAVHNIPTVNETENVLGNRFYLFHTFFDDSVVIGNVRVSLTSLLPVAEADTRTMRLYARQQSPLPFTSDLWNAGVRPQVDANSETVRFWLNNPALNFHMYATYSGTPVGVEEYKLIGTGGARVWISAGEVVLDLAGLNAEQRAVAIYDLYGRCVFNEELQQEQDIRVDMKNSPAGVYLVRVGKTTATVVLLR